MVWVGHLLFYQKRQRVSCFSPQTPSLNRDFQEGHLSTSPDNFFEWTPRFGQFPERVDEDRKSTGEYQLSLGRYSQYSNEVLSPATVPGPGDQNEDLSKEVTTKGVFLDRDRTPLSFIGSFAFIHGLRLGDLKQPLPSLFPFSSFHPVSVKGGDLILLQAIPQMPSVSL